jgi:Ca-activated chloride channel family protein
MSYSFQLLSLRRFGYLAMTLLATSGSLVPTTAQAHRPAPPSASVCRGAEVLGRNDLDLQALRFWLRTYQITNLENLGDRSITRYEFETVQARLLAELEQKIVAEKLDNHTQALKTVVRRYRLSMPESLRGDRSLTQAEFAKTLSEVLEQFKQQVIGQKTAIAAADLTVLQTLSGLYTRELSSLSAQIDELDVAKIESNESYATNGQNGSPTAGSITLSPGYSPPKQGMPSRPQGAGVAGAATLNSLPAPTVNQPHPSGLSGEQRIHPPGTFNTEGYNPIDENPFQRPLSTPLSTFSIDVDTASYSNVRRFLSQGQLPPKDAVRIEELINYFPYDYPQPKGDEPFSVTTEVAAAAWNPKHKLVQIGLKGKELQTLQPSNLVFLVDVSGSMGYPNKLPLVKQSLCMLVNQLSAQDRVTLVVYAGNAGLVLPPTPGNQKAKIIQAIDQLESGGSTAGGEGIELAYKMAQQNFLKDGNNRVILATDGDFNVGMSSDGELLRLIEQKRDRGIFLTVLGFGTGNTKDSKMELLADKGNGNYAYIDTLMEAKKVLVKDLRATLFTIAKDVKIQVEFNPTKVQAYRLIGYENRLLRDRDFNDDTKDAGEIGSGHTVTALYEIIPTGMTSDVKLPDVDPLKYQATQPGAASGGDELMQVKLRYKHPKDASSQLITKVVDDREVSPDAASSNLKFSSAIAMYGMLLRDSELKGQSSFDAVLKLANQAKGQDPEGYRAEFIQLVEQYRKIVLAQKTDSESARKE